MDGSIIIIIIIRKIKTSCMPARLLAILSFSYPMGSDEPSVIAFRPTKLYYS